MCFLQVITTKYGVFCKNKRVLWFYAKQAPTYGVMCYFLLSFGLRSNLFPTATKTPWETELAGLTKLLPRPPSFSPDHPSPICSLCSSCRRPHRKSRALTRPGSHLAARRDRPSWRLYLCAALEDWARCLTLRFTDLARWSEKGNGGSERTASIAMDGGLEQRRGGGSGRAVRFR
jgi:hypothetical protein